MKRKKWMIVLIALLATPTFIFPQIKCLYVSTANGFAPLISDPVVYQMIDWGYELTYVTPADVGIMFPEELAVYNFMFIDEIVGSSTLENIGLEPHPIPIFTTENYAIRANILGYCFNTQAINISAEPIEIVNGDHPLAAGFNTGDQIVVNTGGGAGEDLIPNLPEIDFIPIAKPTTQYTDLYVALGVESGTTTVNGVVTQNRCAVVGFHANGYSAINENGFALIKAGIDWILAGTGVEDEGVSLEQYQLAQNYPNPFNPETTITFQLAKPGHTTIQVFNAQGQLMATLVDEKLSSGNHHITFRGESYPSGIYYYRIQSDHFSTVRKMVLMK